MAPVAEKVEPEPLDLKDISLRLSENVEIEKTLLSGEIMTDQLSYDQESVDDKKCGAHTQDFILFCLKC